MDAFRKAWGRLGDLKLQLLSSIPWQGLTATCPPHVLHFIESSLLNPGYALIRTTSNRPNTMYARYCVNNLDDVKNYDCFIRNPFPSDGKLTDQPRVLIFCDNNNQTRRISRYLNSVSPPQFRDRSFVKHYHGQMSKKYLKQAHDQFILPAGHCRVLVATSGESAVNKHIMTSYEN